MNNLSVRESIVEKVGVNITGAETSAEAMQKAELDYTVALQPYYLPGRSIFGKTVGAVSKLKQAVVRTDTGAELGGVGMKYKPIQPVKCFELLDKAIGPENIAYHRAGEGNNGIWVDLKFSENFFVGPKKNNDEIERHILLMNFWDGSSSLKVYDIANRLFCMNQLTPQNQIMKVRHTQNADIRITEGIKLIKKSIGYYEWFERKCNELFNAPMSDDNMVDFVEEELLPSAYDEEKDELVVSTRLKNARNEIYRLFHEGMGQENCQNTRWAAYNAVSEYTDHIRSTSVRKGRNEGVVRFESTLVGSGASLKSKAFKLLEVN